MSIYATPKTLAEEYEISESSVSRLKRMILEHPERYAGDAVIDFGGKVRIRRDIFHDAIKNRRFIIRGIALPPEQFLKREVFDKYGSQY